MGTGCLPLCGQVTFTTCTLGFWENAIGPLTQETCRFPSILLNIVILWAGETDKFELWLCRLTWCFGASVLPSLCLRWKDLPPPPLSWGPVGTGQQPQVGCLLSPLERGCPSRTKCGLSPGGSALGGGS